MKQLPPPIWALLILGTTYALSLTPPLGELPSFQNTPLAIALIVLGLIAPVWAFSLFRAAGTQISPTSQTNNKLVVTGPFQLTRNPMYLGLVIITLGAAIWIGRPLVFATPVLMFAIANWVHIPFEEAKMRRQFGAEFDAYCARVRRWL